MRTLNTIAFAVVGFGLLALFLRALVVKIEPGQRGVLNAQWTSGLVERDFGPGYHWDVGPLHVWNVFDTTVQTLQMNREARRAGEGDVEGPLQVKSSDGATVTMDITLKYRIKPSRTWKLFVDNGPGGAYKLKVRNVARDVLRRELGGLDTEQFYDPSVRRELTRSMETSLGERLDTMDVTLVSILIRDLQFDPAFERRIREKTLAQQDVELNEAKTIAAEELGKTNEIIAQTQAKVTVINEEKEKTLVTMRAENDKAIAEIAANAHKQEVETKSDADLYAALKKAEATLLVKEAEAKGEALRREALATPGANIYVALELARSLNLGEMSLSTQKVDPLDIDEIVRRLGVK